MTPKNKRRIIIIALAVVAALVALALIIPYFLDVDRYRPRVEAELEQRLGREVSIGRLSLRLLPSVAASLHELKISEDPQFGRGLFLEAERLDVEPALLPLLRGEIRLDELNLVEPKVNLIRTASGVWNCSTLAKSAAAPAAPGTEPGIAPPEIEELAVEHGEVIILDYTAGRSPKPLVYKQIDLAISGLRPGGSGDYQLSFVPPGEVDKEVTLEGSFARLNLENPAETYLKGEIETNELDLAKAWQFLAREQAGALAAGSVSTSTDFEGNLSDEIRLRGEAEFAGLRLAQRGERQVRAALAAEYDLLLSFARNRLQINSAALAAEGAEINVSGSISDLDRARQLDLRLTAEDSAVEGLLKLGSIFGFGPPPGTKAAGTADIDLSVTGTARAPQLVGKVQLSEFTIRHPELDDTISISSIIVNFNRDSLSTNQFSMRAGDRTKLQAQLWASEIDREPRFRLKLRTERPADLNHLIGIASSFGFAPPPGYRARRGEAEFDLEAEGLNGRMQGFTARGSATLRNALIITPYLKEEEISIPLVKIDFGNTRLSTNQFSVAVGDRTRLRAALEAADLDKVPVFSVRLATEQPAPVLDLVAVGSLVGFDLPEGYRVEQGLANFNLQASRITPELNRFRASGQGSVRDLALRVPQIDKRLSIPTVAFRFTDNRVATDQFTVNVGDRIKLAASFGLTARGSDKESLLRIASQAPVSVDEALALGRMVDVTLPAGYNITGGTFTFDLTLRDVLQAEPAVAGRMWLRSSRVKSPFLTESVLVRRADFAVARDSAALSNLDAQVGGSTVTGQLSLRDFDSPLVKFDFAIDQLDLEKLDQLIATGGAAAAPTAPADRDYFGALTVFESSVSARNVKYTTLTFTDASASLNLKDKVLRIPRFAFEFYGGRNVGSMWIDLRGDVPRYEIESRIEQVDLNRLMSANTRYRNVFFGRAAADMRLRGSGSESFEQITRNLVGNGTFRLRDGRITAFSIPRQIDMLANLSGVEFASPDTEVNDINADFRVADGRVFFERMRGQMPQGKVGVEGSFGFDGTVNADVAVALFPALSRRVDRGSIFRNIASATFFLDDSGNVVIPLVMRGPVTSPKFSLNFQAIRANLERQLREGAAGFLEELLRGAQPKAEPEQQMEEKREGETREPGLPDILRELLRKRREKKQP